MKVRETLTSFCEEKNIYPPFNRKKVERAGYNLSDFLLELEKKLRKADDVKTCKAKKTLNAFFGACNELK